MPSPRTVEVSCEVDSAFILKIPEPSPDIFEKVPCVAVTVCVARDVVVRIVAPTRTVLDAVRLDAETAGVCTLLVAERYVVPIVCVLRVLAMMLLPVIRRSAPRPNVVKLLKLEVIKKDSVLRAFVEMFVVERVVAPRPTVATFLTRRLFPVA